MKTATVSPKPDETIHFVHRNSLLDDYLFSMLYHLVVHDPTSCSDETDNTILMFPLWAACVTNSGDSMAESTVSKAFREQWEWIHSIASSYCSNFKEQIPEDLDDPMLQEVAETLDEYGIGDMLEERRIHCGKKRGLQVMGDSYLPPQHLMGHAGWALKTFNTFFDYWVTSKSSMAKSGKKVLSNWKVGESLLDFASGVPPTFGTSELRRDQIDLFVESLVGHNKHVHPELKLLLVANSVRWYKEFIELLNKEPSQRYVQDVNQRHPFAIAFERARISARLDETGFQKMQADVEMGFYRANAYHIPDFLAKLGNDEPAMSIPSTTTLREWISVSDSRTQSMMTTIRDLQKTVGSLLSQNAQIISQNAKIILQNNQILGMQVHAAGGDSIESIDSPEAQSHVPRSFVDFNTIWKLWNTGNGNTDLVTTMFVYLFYDAEKSYAAMSPKTKPMKKGFCTRKTAFQLITKFLEADLVPYSKKDESEDDSGWKQRTVKYLEQAVARIYAISVEKKLLPRRLIQTEK